MQQCTNQAELNQPHQHTVTASQQTKVLMSTRKTSMNWTIPFLASSGKHQQKIVVESWCLHRLVLKASDIHLSLLAVCAGTLKAGQSPESMEVLGGEPVKVEASHSGSLHPAQESFTGLCVVFTGLAVVPRRTHRRQKPKLVEAQRSRQPQLRPHADAG